MPCVQWTLNLVQHTNGNLKNGNQQVLMHQNISQLTPLLYLRNRLNSKHIRYLFNHNHFLCSFFNYNYLLVCPSYEIIFLCITACSLKGTFALFCLAFVVEVFLCLLKGLCFALAILCRGRCKINCYHVIVLLHFTSCKWLFTFWSLFYTDAIKGRGIKI